MGYWVKMVYSTTTESRAQKHRRVSVEEQPTGVRAAVYSFLGLLLQVIIEWLVRLPEKDLQERGSWLDCVLGKPGVIGTGVYQRIAEERKLEISQRRRRG